jgi:murein DD-endopeptidase MepM/ murein hydrolase activator NlpD
MSKVLRRFLLITFSMVLLTACNMPRGGNQSNQISGNELKQTLSAQDDIFPQDGTSIPPNTFPLQPTTTETYPINQNPGLSLGQEYENPGDIYIYYAKDGDTVIPLSKRFGVEPEEIQSALPLPSTYFIKPGQLLEIPNALGTTLSPRLILPDNEVIFSPSASNFQIKEYIDQAGGYLSTYTEVVNDQILTGAEIIERVSSESSVNPKLLLAFLDFRSNWVTGNPSSSQSIEHPIGFRVPNQKGLYLEMVLTGTQLNTGYYGWRGGAVTEVKFPDKAISRLNPTPNAGTIAVQYLFAKFYHRDRWNEVLYGEDNFADHYALMFGNPWENTPDNLQIFGENVQQPALELPFSPGEKWSLTGGPHSSWNSGSPRGAIDFAPVTGEPACAVSRAWVTASADGEVVRAANNVVVIDLDGDGNEQTGWTIVYLHIAEDGMISAGQFVGTGDPIGHPSCERGTNTGTHVHIARKYNGEWLPVDGALPFVLSDWEVIAGTKNYEGKMIKNGETVYANPGGNQTSIIIR